MSKRRPLYFQRYGGQQNRDFWQGRHRREAIERGEWTVYLTPRSDPSWRWRVQVVRTSSASIYYRGYARTRQAALFRVHKAIRALDRDSGITNAYVEAVQEAIKEQGLEGYFDE